MNPTRAKEPRCLCTCAPLGPYPVSCFTVIGPLLLLLLGALSLLTCSSSFAQTTSATIDGQITDTQGKIVPGVEVDNILNHPNFGNVDFRLKDGPFTVTTMNRKTTYSGFGGARNTLNNTLGNGTGLSPLYQPGGPRSLQLALKLTF